MSIKSDATARLSNVLNALESAILESDDKEILEFSNASTAKHSLRNISPASVGDHPQRVDGKRPISFAEMPEEFAKRVRFVKSLIANRHDVPLQLVSVFSGGRRPSDDELDDVIQELISRGIIKK